MNRAVSGTNQNARSSRSHTIFVLDVEQKNSDGSTKTARLNLVDLAGSERIEKTGATGQTLKEAQKINLSLTTLGMCIKSLTENASHVPFRDSKLTLYLRQSLGGNSKTLLICTASALQRHYDESYQTCRFAKRAKKVKNKATSNILRSREEMEAFIKKLKSEVAALKKQLVENGIKPDTKKFISKGEDEEEEKTGDEEQKSEGNTS
jgi:kinesin family member 5